VPVFDGVGPEIHSLTASELRGLQTLRFHDGIRGKKATRNRFFFSGFVGAIRAEASED